QCRALTPLRPIRPSANQRADHAAVRAGLTPMKEVHDHVGEALERVSRRRNSAVQKAKANGGAPREPDDHTATQQSAWKSGSFSAKELQSMEFPPIAWIVRNIISAEGVVLLCSKPKFGKSWLAYDLCIACTTDRFTLGTIKPAQGNVLY